MKSLEIIEFWFEEIEPKQWWVKNPEFDSIVVKRFSGVYEKATRCELHSWRETAEGRLAEVIVLDQFSRNMFRDAAQAFAFDSLALVLAQEAVSHGIDKELSDKQRPFLYLPFMHSESLTIHDTALQLYTDNGSEGELKFEIKHREIIKQFGRYPHRNEVLGRTSTSEEIEFLTQPGSSF